MRDEHSKMIREGLADLASITPGRRQHRIESVARAFRLFGLDGSQIDADEITKAVRDEVVRQVPECWTPTLEQFFGCWLAGDEPPGEADDDEESVVKDGDDVLVLTRLADVEPEEVVWLWEDRIPRGKLSILAGDPGLGKTFVTHDVGARISTGEPWPGSTDRQEPGSVVFLSAEDGVADTIVPRLAAHGADLTRIFVVDAVRRAGDPDNAERLFVLSVDLGLLEAQLATLTNPRLVVIDPINAYLGDRIDSHSDAKVRGVLTPLAKFAERTGVSVIAVMHLNKATTIGLPLYRVVGSIGYVAAARAVFCIVRDRTDPNLRYMLPAKNNLGPDHGTGLAFRIPNGERVAWDLEAEVPESAAAYFSDSGREQSQGRKDTAVEWLLDVLSDRSVAVVELRRQAEDDGLTWRTIERAKKELGVMSVRNGLGPRGKWSWCLPPRGRSPPL